MEWDFPIQWNGNGMSERNGIFPFHATLVETHSNSFELLNSWSSSLCTLRTRLSNHSIPSHIDTSTYNEVVIRISSGNPAKCYVYSVYSAILYRTVLYCHCVIVIIQYHISFQHYIYPLPYHHLSIPLHYCSSL
jgi:hypothetical protein